MGSSLREDRLLRAGLLLGARSRSAACPTTSVSAGAAAEDGAAGGYDDDDGEDSSVSDDVDVLAREVEVMVGEIRALQHSQGGGKCQPGGGEQAVRLRGLLMAMDLRWQERSGAGDGGAAAGGQASRGRPGVRAVDRMIESIGVRSRFLLRHAAARAARGGAAAGTIDNDNDGAGGGGGREWPACPAAAGLVSTASRSAREPIALDYVPQPTPIPGAERTDELRGRTVFKHSIEMSEQVDSEGKVSKAYKISNKSRISASDIYAER